MDKRKDKIDFEQTSRNPAYSQVNSNNSSIARTLHDESSKAHNGDEQGDEEFPLWDSKAGKWILMKISDSNTIKKIKSDVLGLKTRLAIAEGKINKQKEDIQKCSDRLEQLKKDYDDRIDEINDRIDRILEEIHSATGVRSDSFGARKTMRFGRNQVAETDIAQFSQRIKEIEVLCDGLFQVADDKDYYRLCGGLFRVLASEELPDDKKAATLMTKDEIERIDIDDKKTEVEKLRRLLKESLDKIGFSWNDYPKYDLIIPSDGDLFEYTTHESVVKHKNLTGQLFKVEFCVFPGIMEQTIDHYTSQVTSTVRLKAKVWLQETTSTINNSEQQKEQVSIDELLAKS